MTPQTAIGHNKIAGLDFLRAVAILSVFLCHYSILWPHPQWLNAIGEYGWTGVDLFFVLSGFLIATQLFKSISRTNRISVKEFFIKRFFRIIPAYLTVLAIYFFIPLFREWEALAPLWKYLTFTQNYHLDAHRQGTFSHAWSLCIEEQFYLFFPFILGLLVYFNVFRKGYLLLICLFVAGLFIRANIWEQIKNDANLELSWTKWIYFPTYCRLDGLLTGISLAAIFQFRPRLREILERYGNFFLLGGLLLLAFAFHLCTIQESFPCSVFGLLLIAWGYGLLVLGALCPTSFLYHFSSRIVSRISTLSYCMYLLHQMTIHLAQGFFGRYLRINHTGTLMFFICLGVTLAGSFLLSSCIEMPFLKLRRKILMENKLPQTV